MKRIRIVGIAILVLSLCIILGITAWADSSNVVTYSATADKTVVCGDKEETVALTVGIDKTDFVVQTIELWVTVPDGWVIESVTNDAVTFDKGEGNKAGMFSWWDLTAEGKAIDYVAEITIKIPANTANGDYAITVGKMEMLDGGFGNVSIVPDEITATIKVGHTPVTDKAVAPDCENTGLTEGSHCSVCGAILDAQQEVPALGHKDATPVIGNEVAATCTKEGSYDIVVCCSVCGEELSRTTTPVDALGHNLEDHEAKAPTCTEIGWDAYETCTRCDYTTYVEKKELGHTDGTPVIENNVDPTCTATGSYDTVVCCSVCNAELSRVNTVVDALDHNRVPHDAKAPTCTAIGWDAYETCTRCDYTTYVEKKELGHTPVTDKAVAPDCENTGLTEGSHCSVCGETLVAQTPVDALGHKYVAVTTPATCNSYGNTTYTCSVCEDEYSDAIDPDPNNHAGTKVNYTHSNADTHSAIYVCCGAPYVTNEPHSYDEETALCVCGRGKAFTFTVYGMDGVTVIYTKEIAYGSEIFNYVDKTYVSNRYGNTLAIVEAITLGSDADYWADDAIMPKGNVEIQAYWSGWSVDNNGAQYISKNETVKGWFEVDGDYYYADANGYTVAGTVRVAYPTFTIGGNTYAPNDEDVAYAASKGRVFIDAEMAWFVFGADGKFQSGMTGIQDGKYVKNGMIAWHAGLVNIDGELYYFVGDAEKGGNKFANGNVWVTRTNGVAGLTSGECYNFVDGKLSGLNGIVDGKYFENSEMVYGAGLVKLGDKYIYVRSNGNIVMDDKYYIPENTLGVVSGRYYFDENGYMVNPNTNLYNGVVDGYYYINGKVVYGAGLIEIDGDIYYVRSNGQVATGEYYVTNVNIEGFTSGQKLYFGEDGKLLPIKNGIVEEEGKLYYYENNSIKYGAGVVELTDENGDVYYIYVRSNGQLATGKYWPTTLNDYLTGGEYDWGTDGKYYPGK